MPCKIGYFLQGDSSLCETGTVSVTKEMRSEDLTVSEAHDIPHSVPCMVKPVPVVGENLGIFPITHGGKFLEGVGGSFRERHHP